MSLREELRALDEGVVDDAIERIANGLNYLSCVALVRAQGVDDFIILLEDVKSNPYVIAYRENTWVLGMKPIWWDSGEDYSAARIQALEDFRDAIIAAKNPTILERIKGWLAAPCEIPN